MAFNPDHAKRMRAAYLPVKGKQTVQVGHQSCSFGQVTDASAFLKDGKARPDHRDRRHDVPQHSARKTAVVTAGVPDMNPREHPVEQVSRARRRKFRSTQTVIAIGVSSGIIRAATCTRTCATRSLSGTRCSIFRFPKAVTMTGGLYLWRDGREVPDTMNVSMEQPEDLLFSWVSGFGNSSARRQRRRSWDRWNNLQRRSDSLSRRKRSTSARGSATGHIRRRRRAPICRTSSIAFEAAKKQTARSNLDSVFPLPAAWQWKATARSATMQWDPQAEEIV